MVPYDRVLIRYISMTYVTDTLQSTTNGVIWLADVSYPQNAATGQLKATRTVPAIQRHAYTLGMQKKKTSA